MKHKEKKRWRRNKETENRVEKSNKYPVETPGEERQHREEVQFAEYPLTNFQKSWKTPSHRHVFRKRHASM